MNYNINDEIIVISTNEKKRIKEIELIDGIEILYTYDNCSYANFQTAKINSLEIENLHQLICNSTYYQIQREKTIKACTLWVKETENFYRQTFKKKKKYWIF